MCYISCHLVEVNENDEDAAAAAAANDDDDDDDMSKGYDVVGS